MKSEKKQRKRTNRGLGYQHLGCFFYFFCDCLRVCLREKGPGLFIRSNGLESLRRDYFYLKMRLMEE